MLIAEVVTNTDPGLLKRFLEGILPILYIDSYWWTVFGTMGQVTFAGRFIVQWLFSEKKGHIVIPAMFWHLSFWGSCINFIYCLHLDKLPLILGCFFLPVLYARNLWIHYHPKTKTV